MAQEARRPWPRLIFDVRQKPNPMPWTIENALEDQSITHAACLESEYRIRVGELPDVKIRVWKLLKGSGRFYFTRSHYIHTPVQPGPHRTSSSHAEDEADALHLAVMTLVPHYNEAVAQAHEPRESWLIRNEHF